MTVLRNKIIDIANHTEEDLVINNIYGDSISFVVSGGAHVTFKGGHAGFEDDKMYSIAFINMSTLKKVTETSGDGVYCVILNGINRLELAVSGSGFINWKEIGD